MKIKLIFALLVVFVNDYVLLKANLNDDNYHLNVYKYSEVISNLSSDELKSITYLTLDLKMNRYQLEQISTYDGGGQEKLVSQGSLEINNDQIKLIDKNNAIIFIGIMKNDTIILHSGIKYLVNKIFIKVEDLSGMWKGVMKFFNWDDIYKLPNSDKNHDTVISLGIYSGEYLDENSNGLFIELTNQNYQIYFVDGEKVKFDITSGHWFIKLNKLQLKDDDNLNTFTFIILDNKTLMPSSRLPFVGKIKPLSLIEK